MLTWLVVDDPEQVAVVPSGARLVTAADYLATVTTADAAPQRVVNLCGSLRWQSIGYYVSLLAEARGHQPLPTARTIQDLELGTQEQQLSVQLAPLLARTLATHRPSALTLHVYFGQCVVAKWRALAAELFRWFAAPLLRVELRRQAGGWRLSRVAALPLAVVPPRQRGRLWRACAAYLELPSVPALRRRIRARLAILYRASDDPLALPAPSNPAAIERFLQAAERLGLAAEVLTPKESARLSRFDGLFIRVSTDLRTPTLKLARRSEAAGLVVVDDPESIIKCSDKAYLAERLRRAGILLPRTLLANRQSLPTVAAALGFPCVLKTPDSYDSKGVFKAASLQQLLARAEPLFAESHFLVVQEYLPTEFDWRIGLFDQTLLFASRYYMAPGHWQVVKHRPGGRALRGRDDSVALAAVPTLVAQTALAAAATIGSGLYGIDLKESGGRCYCIEVNDNPSIDHGIEDKAAGRKLYEQLLAILGRRLGLTLDAG